MAKASDSDPPPDGLKYPHRNGVTYSVNLNSLDLAGELKGLGDTNRLILILLE